MTRLHLFWSMSLQKNLPIFIRVQVWVANLYRCHVSLCLCYLKIMSGNMPENFRGETHSISEISSKKEKELKNYLSSSDSLISVSTSASNVHQQTWIHLVQIPLSQGHLGPVANLFNCRIATKIMKKKVTRLVMTFKMMSSRKSN